MEEIYGTQSGNRLRKVVVIGPESTGKTTLAQALALHFRCQLVTEYAREYLDALNDPYQESDLLQIAKGQLALEDKCRAGDESLMICDTDLLVLKVWSLVKYGRCHDFIQDAIRARQCDLYLLTGTEVPWQFDPQREHPEFRNELWTMYQKEIVDLRVPYHKISGDPEQRLRRSIPLITNLD